MRNFILTMLLCVASFSVMGQDHRADYVWGVEGMWGMYKKQLQSGPNQNVHNLSGAYLLVNRNIAEYSFGKRKTKYAAPVKNNTLGLNVGVGVYTYQIIYYTLFNGAIFHKERGRPYILSGGIYYVKKMKDLDLKLSLLGFIPPEEFGRNAYSFKVQIGLPKNKNWQVLPGIGVGKMTDYNTGTYSSIHNYPTIHALLEFRFGSGWAL